MGGTLADFFVQIFGGIRAKQTGQIPVPAGSHRMMVGRAVLASYRAQSAEIGTTNFPNEHDPVRYSTRRGPGTVEAS